MSTITAILEAGFANLSADRRTRLHEIVASMVELEMSEAVIQRAIALRQQKKMSLADTVIGATALVHDLPLVEGHSSCAGLAARGRACPCRARGLAPRARQEHGTRQKRCVGPLVTRNVDDFKHIAGLRLINPFGAS